MLLVENIAGEGFGDVILFYIKIVLGLKQAAINSALLVFRISLVVVPALVMPALKAVGITDLKIVFVALLTLIASFTILAVLPTLAAFYIGVVLYTFNLLQGPSLIAVVAPRVPEKERGLMVGAFKALGSISSLIGTQLTYVCCARFDVYVCMYVYVCVYCNDSYAHTPVCVYFYDACVCFYLHVLMSVYAYMSESLSP
jgi:hypothetical protein